MTPSKQKLVRVKPENISGNEHLVSKNIPILRSKNYIIQNGFAISGDAPKEFIKIFKSGESKRTNTATWPLYLAKTARKWYPNESVMEYLLNQIGNIWGLNMADSELVLCNGQIRFLSKYFLKKEEVLVHCANLYAKCFNNEGFIKYIDACNLENGINNIQLFKNSLSMAYNEDGNRIFQKFLHMILFDALVGNNDRHFYNYGIIENIIGDKNPRFSPIYDTARGLLWNIPEKKVLTLSRDENQKNLFLKKYISNSKPKIGWYENQEIDHFQMVQFIKSSNYIDNLNVFFDVNKLNAVLHHIDISFAGILSPERVSLVKECLTMRFEKIKQIVL